MAAPETRFLMSHDLSEGALDKGVRFERRPARLPDGTIVQGLYNAWIWLDNPGQYNSYTTEMVKSVILAFRAASNARDVSCVVFTGAGDKAFCTGGNTKEYAEYYAGRRSKRTPRSSGPSARSWLLGKRVSGAAMRSPVSKLAFEYRLNTPGQRGRT